MNNVSRVNIFNSMLNSCGKWKSMIHPLMNKFERLKGAMSPRLNPWQNSETNHSFVDTLSAELETNALHQVDIARKNSGIVRSSVSTGWIFKPIYLNASCEASETWRIFRKSMNQTATLNQMWIHSPRQVNSSGICIFTNRMRVRKTEISEPGKGRVLSLRTWVRARTRHPRRGSPGNPGVNAG